MTEKGTGEVVRRPSIDRMLRDAGMRVLKGTLSLSLVAALVPVRASSADARTPVDVGAAPAEGPASGDDLWEGGDGDDAVTGAAEADDEGEPPADAGAGVMQEGGNAAHDDEGHPGGEEGRGGSESRADVAEGYAAAGVGVSADAIPSSGAQGVSEDEAPTVRVLLADAGDRANVQDVTRERTRVVTDRTTLVVEVTDRQGDLDLDGEKSFVRVARVDSEEGEPATFAFACDAHDGELYRVTSADGTPDVPLDRGSWEIAVFAEDAEGNRADAWSLEVTVGDEGPAPLLEAEGDEAPDESSPDGEVVLRGPVGLGDRAPEEALSARIEVALPESAAEGRGESLEGTLFCRVGPQVRVHVSGPGFSEEASRVVNAATGAEYDVAWERQADDAWTGTFSLEEGLHTTLVATVSNGSESVEASEDVNVAVDLVAPTVESAVVSRGPDRTLPADGDEGDLEVHGEETVVTLALADGGGLASVETRGAETTARVDTSGVTRGAKTGTVTVTLGADGDLLGRSTLLEIRDLAGNSRMWSIAPTGTVTNGLGEPAPEPHAPLDGHLGYPFALVLDAEPPALRLSGIAEGALVADGAQLAVSIEETNLELLRAFDNGQEVVLVRRTLPDGSVEQRFAVVPLASFVAVQGGGVRPSYQCVLPFSEEGDYLVTARVTDIAGHQSEEVTRSFAVDRSAPVVRIEGVGEGEFSNDASRTATVTVDERHFDEDAVTITATGTGPDGASEVVGVVADGWTHEGDLHTTTVTFTEEGTYDLAVEVTDAAGNEGASLVRGFTLDRTAPLVSYAWNGGAANEDHGGSFFGTAQTLVISVAEANWDEGGFAPVRVEGGARARAVVVEDGWVRTDEVSPDGLPLYTCTLEFAEDAAYPGFTVSGADRAGNVATMDLDAPQALPAAIAPFTLDTTSPVVTVERLDAATGVADGVDYYARPTSVTVTVQDRTFDPAASSLVSPGGTLTQPFRKVDQTDDFVVTWEAVVSYREGSHMEPRVVAQDKAGNRSRARSGAPFVVDLTAPKVTAVTVDRKPTSIGVDAKGERQFFRRPTSITIDVADNFRIKEAGARLVDPQHEYTRDLTLSKDRKTGTVSVGLVDGTASANDTEFDRYEGSRVELTVVDVAGNSRSWSLDKRGTVSDLRGSSARNASVNGSNAHPLALIEDMTGPVVALSGASGGAYYTSARTVHATVNELNFAYLRMFDAGRAVLHVTRREAAAGRAESSWDVPASAFEGSGPEWSHDEVFETDGHYAVRASFDDYANNPSNVALIDEFTIDRTAPVITVTFDNDDVRNGRYYNAPRTATVTVHEHNFDPSRFSIDTNGSVGGWSTVGDTHTCVVAFAADGTYSLKVSGTDLAGNEAVPFAEPEFVIDTQAPTISFGGVGERLGAGDLSDEASEDGRDALAEGAYRGPVVDGEAYNGVVAPAVTYADEQNYDPLGWSLTLAGNKAGDVTESSAYEVSDDTNAQTVTFSDLGSIPEGDTDSYDVDADDIYTIHATLADLAGNAVEEDLTFSVNRFGSNYLVSMLDDETGSPYAPDAEMLPQAPRVMVREINVSGVGPEGDSRTVSKEYAGATREIRQDATGAADEGEGYRLSVPSADDAVNGYGWSEYVYAIRAANFGAQTGEQRARGEGQGLYRVNVSSRDAASNANTTADYWASDARRAQVSQKVGTAEFVLDQQGPVIDAADLPGAFALGTYEASFHVTDALTSQARPNTVTVLVDGVPAADLADEGGGTFTFTVPARSFALRSVSVTVSDYAGREDVLASDGSYVTSLVPEVLIACGVLVAIVGGVSVARRRREVADPDAAERRHAE